MLTISIPPALRVLLTLASFTVVVAGMKAASSILVPFFLAMLISIICAPPMYWMQARGVPKGIAVLIILVFIIAAGFLIGTFVGRSVQEFGSELPKIKNRLSVLNEDIVTFIESKGFELSDDAAKGLFNPNFLLSMITNTLSSFTVLLTNAFLILLTVVFILLEASGFPAKLRASLDHPGKTLTGLNTFLESVNRYLAIKTIFSLITGLLIFIWLTIIDLDYPLLWGMLAFLLNFVPNIGSIIAAVPPVLLALIQNDKIWPAVLTAAGHLAINMVIGSLTEPRFMGKGLGMSTLVVFLSLVFWGWVLGPVGMLLSVLLTMILKIALESNEDTRWLAIILGAEAPEGNK
ncbi:MAG: AI-2E family transporter [Verrucomicrobiota bacterium]